MVSSFEIQNLLLRVLSISLSPTLSYPAMLLCYLYCKPSLGQSDVLCKHLWWSCFRKVCWLSLLSKYVSFFAFWAGGRAVISAILKDRFATWLVSSSERCAEGVSLPWWHLGSKVSWLFLFPHHCCGILGADAKIKSPLPGSLSDIEESPLASTLWNMSLRFGGCSYCSVTKVVLTSLWALFATILFSAQAPYSVFFQPGSQTTI